MRIALCGSHGKMGKEVIKAFSNQHDIIEVCRDKHCLNDIIDTVDIVIDFTNGKGAFVNGVISLTHNVPIIIGSTGILAKHKETLKTIANCREVGCILSSNFSVGILWMKECVKELKPYFENITIEEEYNKSKLEALGGTALSLKEILEIDSDAITSIRTDSFDIVHRIIFDNGCECITIEQIIHDRSAYMIKLGECIEEVMHIHGFYEYD